MLKKFRFRDKTDSFEKTRAWDMLPWIWLVSAYCITVIGMYLFGRNYVDSDMASEMVYAAQINKEHVFMSTNWWYSTEVRIFCLQLVTRFTLLLFPNDWFAARVMGQAVWLLFLIGSYLYVAQGLNLKHKGAWGAAALMCPFGLWYLGHGIFGGFYLPAMVLVLLSIGLVLHILKDQNRLSRIIQMICLECVCFISGLTSVKGLMAIYLPMIVASVVVCVLQLHQTPNKKLSENIRLIGITFGAAASAAIGYLVNSVCLTPNYSVRNYNNQSWINFSVIKLVNTWEEFLSLFGFQYDSYWKTDVQFFFSVWNSGSLRVSAGWRACMGNCTPYDVMERVIIRRTVFCKHIYEHLSGTGMYFFNDDMYPAGKCYLLADTDAASYVHVPIMV